MVDDVVIVSSFESGFRLLVLLGVSANVGCSLNWLVVIRTVRVGSASISQVRFG